MSTWNKDGRKASKPYVVDSTKGGSLMEPKSYKGDALVQVWIDSRVLATISNWLDKEGNFTRFLSEVLREGMELLCEQLVRNGQIEMVEDTAYARKLLERKYRVNLNPEGRGSKNVLHNEILSNRRMEIGEKIESKVRDIPEGFMRSSKVRRFTEGEIEAIMNSPDVIRRARESKMFEYEKVDREAEVVVKREDAAEVVKSMRREDIDIPDMKEKGNTPEMIRAHIERADEEEKKKLDALNSLDIEALMSSNVVKEEKTVK